MDSLSMILAAVGIMLLVFGGLLVLGLVVEMVSQAVQWMRREDR